MTSLEHALHFTPLAGPESLPPSWVNRPPQYMHFRACCLFSFFIWGWSRLRSDSMSKMSFVASPTYVRSSPLRTVGSNSRKLINRFSKRLVHFRQQRPTRPWSLSGSNGANGGRPLRGTFALVLVLVVLEVGPCGGGVSSLSLIDAFVSLDYLDESCMLCLKRFPGFSRRHFCIGIDDTLLLSFLADG